jgi:phage shock protein C
MSGFDRTKTLYRDSKNGRIAGVCAGIAEYFGLEKWLVRILTVTAFFLLAGPFVIVTYIAAWFILDKKPLEHYDNMMSKNAYVPTPVSSSGQYAGKGYKNAQANGDSKIEVKSRVWQAGEPPRQAFYDIQQRFRGTETRLRKLETYVTSKEFQLNREISRL